MDQKPDEAKLIFWKAHLFGKLPIEVLRQDYFDDAVDTVIFNAGFSDWCKTMASLSGLKV